ncbi:MAG: hypothetical protein AAFO69_14125 [Bacteroidota bacterium]
MKLIDVVSLIMSFGTMIMGIDQAMVHGIANSYWIFMISLSFLFVYSYRKAKRKEEEKQAESASNSKPKSNKKKR